MAIHKNTRDKKLQKYLPYRQVKLINMNILQVKKCYLPVKSNTKLR